MQHALKADDLEQATHVLVQHGPALAFSGRYQTLLGWMDRLPEALVRAHPLLALMHATVLILVRQLARAEGYLKSAENSVDADTPVEAAWFIRGWAALCRAELANYVSSDLAASVALARQALALLPETEETAPIRAGASYYIARSIQISGDRPVVWPPRRRQVEGERLLLCPPGARSKAGGEHPSG